MSNRCCRVQTQMDQQRRCSTPYCMRKASTAASRLRRLFQTEPIIFTCGQWKTGLRTAADGMWLPKVYRPQADWVIYRSKVGSVMARTQLQSKIKHSIFNSRQPPDEP